MPTRSHVLATGLLATACIIGGAAGWSLKTWAVSHRRDAVDPHATLTYLTKQLDLSAGQQDSVRFVLDRRRKQVDSIWHSARPGIDSLRKSMQAEIHDLLTPTQQVRFRDLMAWFDRERRAGDSASRDVWDADHDGIPYWADRCRNTPSSVPVDAQGCPVYLDHDGGK